MLGRRYLGREEVGELECGLHQGNRGNEKGWEGGGRL